jgi:hypothetical protein
MNESSFSAVGRAESTQQVQPRSPSQTGTSTFAGAPPTIALPKGGGAIRGIGEKFASNPVTGTGSMTVPIPVRPSVGSISSLTRQEHRAAKFRNDTGAPSHFTIA